MTSPRSQTRQNTTAAVEQDAVMSERDRLVLHHLLVRAIAVRVYENLPVHVDLEDLIHAGCNRACSTRGQ